MEKFKLLVIPMLATCAQPALANEALTLGSLDAFYGMCLNEDYTSQKLIDLAALLGWEALSPELIKHYRPEGEMAYWSGWIAKNPSEPSIPFFAFAGIGQDATETCGAFFGRIDANLFVSKVIAETGSKIEHEETSYLGSTIFLSTPSLPNAYSSIQTDREKSSVAAFTVFER